MNAAEHIEDDERLFRRVLNERNEDYRIDEVCKVVRPSSQAFGDRKQRPSVDRERLCSDGVQSTMQTADSGALRLVAGEVRGIDNIVSTIKEVNKAEVRVLHAIDVLWRRENGNEAHSQIEPSPEYSSKNAFRKVCERLAKLAHFEVLPDRARGRNLQCGHCNMPVVDHVWCPAASQAITSDCSTANDVSTDGAGERASDHDSELVEFFPGGSS